MTRIVFDFETAPIEECETYLDPVEAPSNYKDQAKIDAYVREKSAEQIPRCALDPDLCRVVAIGTWLEGAEAPEVYSVQHETERALLEHVWGLLRSDVPSYEAIWEKANRAGMGQLPVPDRARSHLVGFNCLGFDLPVLLRRSLYLGIPAPTIQIDRFKHPQVTDLLSVLSFDGKLKFRGLDWYCRRFGIDVVDNIQGSDIGRLVAAGEWAQVEGHCLADVMRTGRLAARMGLFQVQPEKVRV